MRFRHRVALLALLGTPFALPMVALADSALSSSAGSYYITQIGYGAVARVDIDSSGKVTVLDKYISGLPTGGPDSAVFAPDGTLLVSNFTDGTISRVDVNSRKILQQQVNQTRIEPAADLAMDPKGNDVIAIARGSSGADAVVRVDLGSGATTPLNPDSVADVGGLTFNDDGSRLFVSSHTGVIYELNPASGHVVRQAKATGSPDGMTFDPSTGNLFASGCGGLCELSTSNGSLSMVKVLSGADGDGIAADGHGHVYIAEGSCADFCMIDLASEKAVVVSSSVSGSDDVTPLVGAGSAAGGTCLTVGSCFPGPVAAGLAVAGVSMVLYLGASGLGGNPGTGGVPLQTAPAGSGGHVATAASHLGHAAHAGAAHSMAAVGPGAHGPPPAPPPVHGAGAASPPHGPAEGATTDSSLATHVQEEAGDKMLEMGGAGLEHGAGAVLPAAGEAADAEAAAGAEGIGGARSRREGEPEHPAPPAAPPPPEPPPV